jgi:rhodanese-related sulfurtransferase
METITRNDLREKMERGDDFVLIEVLPPESYDKHHLPGAINIPLGKGFEENVQQAVKDKDQEVVVYCSDENCPASPNAAKKLESMGYQRVRDYEKGKVDWMQNGLKVIEKGEQPS